MRKIIRRFSATTRAKHPHRPGCAVESLESRRLLSAVLVKDIRIGSLGSYPTEITSINGTTFFIADDTADTASGGGASSLFSIAPGAASAVKLKSLTNVSPYTQPLANFGGNLYFQYYDPSQGTQLWKSNGTAAGTTPVATINVGFTNPVALSSELLFNGANQLWETDGTQAGTHVVTPIAGKNNINFISDLVSLNGEAYFQANGPDGDQLWKSDGTANGTQEVTNFLASQGGFSPTNILVANNSLFFTGRDLTTSAQDLFKSDGTAGGTVSIGSYVSVNPRTSAGGLVYYQAQVGSSVYLYETDGTPGAGVQLHKIIGTSYVPTIAAGGRVFFIDQGLYQSNGTVGGTALIGNSGAAPVNWTLSAVGGSVWYQAKDAQGRLAIWKTDGTAPGTSIVSHIALQYQQSLVTNIADINGQAFFGADDGSGIGTELWKSDGTPVGTTLVADVNLVPLSSYPQKLANVNGTLILTASATAAANGLDASDGTAAGTVGLGSANVPPPTVPVVSINGVGYWADYFGGGGYQFLLYRTDGTAAGTYMVDNLNPNDIGRTLTSPSPFITPVGNELYFMADDAVHGIGLWKSDGTPTGTSFVKAGSGISLFSLNGQLYFFGIGPRGYQLFTSDGTPGGTVMLKEINPTGDGVYPNGGSGLKVYTLGNTAYFQGTDGVHGNQFWKTDGTAQGTSAISNVVPDGTGPNFAAIGSSIYIHGTVGGVEGIWKTDGTPQGTMQILTSAAPIYNLGTVGSLLVYDSPAASSEQWYSLDPAVGTPTPLVTLNPNSYLGPAIGNKLYLIGNSLLWQTDGTAAGTQIVNGSPANPSELAVANGTLFFSGYDAVHGNELWADLPAAPPAAPTSFTVASISNTSTTLSFSDLNGDYNGYFLQRSATNDFANLDETIQLPSTQTSYTELGLNPDTTYFYRITAGNRAGQSGPLTVAVVTPHGGASTPTQLGAIANSSTQITVTWTDPAGDQTGFIVERSTNPNFATIDFSTSTTLMNYVDTAVVQQTTYYYRGRAINNVAPSLNVVTQVTTPILPPGAPTASIVLSTGTNLIVNWTAGAGYAASFLVQRKVNNGSYQPVNFNPIFGYLSDTNVPGNTYYYQVRATNAGGLSPWSSEVSYAIPLQSAVLLKDINLQSSGVAGHTANSAPQSFASVGSTAYFAATDGLSVSQLWKSDGTTAGTVVLTKFTSGGLANLTSFNGALYFILETASSMQLWTSNGTVNGTVLVATINNGNSPPSYFTVAGNLMFFAAQQSGGGRLLLWRTDGTANGTFAIPGTNIASYVDSPAVLTAVGSEIYFSGTLASDNIGNQLLASDGTAAGTHRVVNLSPTNAGSDPQNITNVGGALYFEAFDQASGNDGLFKSDGTAQGTALLHTFGGNSFPQLDGIVDFNGTAFFNANDGVHGSMLWKSDGTPGGTVMVQDPAGAAPIANSAHFMLVIGSSLYFQAYDANFSLGLWKTDGSGAGTVRLNSILTGAYTPNFHPVFELNVNGMLYYSDARNVYKTDGSVGGNKWVDSVALGSNLSGQNAAYATVAGNALFFAADDGVHGLEPFVVQAPKLVQPAAAGKPSVHTALTVLGGDTAGESGLTYTWTVTATPSTGDGGINPSAANVTFTPANANGTNAGKSVTANFSQSGAYTLQVSITNPLTGLSTTSSVSVTVPTAITDVVVDGTSWSSTFLSYLSGLSALNVGGYSIPVGSTAQLKPLPWTNLNQVQVVFNGSVNLTQSSMQLIGVNTPNYSFGNFSYNASTFTATWTMPQAITRDKLLIVINSTAVIDGAGKQLDGEWRNNLSTYPSGDGTPGGRFQFLFDVLPGDVNQSAGVNILDTSVVQNHQGASTTSPGYSILYDVDGSGVINVVDTGAVKNQQAATLPAGNPAVPPLPSTTVLAAGMPPTPVTSSFFANATFAMTSPLLFSQILIGNNQFRSILMPGSQNVLLST